MLEEKTKLYKFYKADCAPCYAVGRTLLMINLPKDIEIISINVDEEKNKEIAKQYGIEKVPTLLFENGKSLVGINTRKTIEDFIAARGN